MNNFNLWICKIVKFKTFFCVCVCTRACMGACVLFGSVQDAIESEYFFVAQFQFLDFYFPSFRFWPLQELSLVVDSLPERCPSRAPTEASRHHFFDFGGSGHKWYLTPILISKGISIFWHDGMRQRHIISQLLISCMDSSIKGGHLWYYTHLFKKEKKRKNREKLIGRQIDQTSHVFLKMVYKCFRYLVSNFSDKTPHVFISQWEEAYNYRIQDEASRAWLQYGEAIFSKPESSLYLLSNNVRVYKLYCAEIENRLVWEALERRLITWEDSSRPSVFHSLSHDCQGECKPDRFMSPEDANYQAFALNSKIGESGREMLCACYQISILLSWSNDRTAFCPTACVFNLLTALLTSVQREGRIDAALLVWWHGALIGSQAAPSLPVPLRGSSGESRDETVENQVCLLWSDRICLHLEKNNNKKKFIPTSLLAIHMNSFHTPTSLLKSVTYTLHCNWQNICESKNRGKKRMLEGICI